MGVDAKWGCFPICPEMSRFVPVCPLLSFLGPGTGTNRDKRGQTGTKRDISGQIGKRPHLALLKRPFFFMATQKTTIFLFFWKLSFPFFHFSLLLYLTQKNKNKKCIFYRTPFFDTSTTCQQDMFTPLHTICDFKLPKTL